MSEEEYRISNIMEDAPMEEAQAEDAQPQIAGIGERFVALLIDFGLIANLYGACLWFFGRNLAISSMVLLYLVILAVIIPFILYMTFIL